MSSNTSNSLQRILDLQTTKRSGVIALRCHCSERQACTDSIYKCILLYQQSASMMHGSEGLLACFPARAPLLDRSLWLRAMRRARLSLPATIAAPTAFRNGDQRADIVCCKHSGRQSYLCLGGTFLLPLLERLQA